ncbi:MAG: DUF5317 domain-containing protein [Actinomycetia bacterium]|nr:DUF5317 domain-containing protein [Actinomycetes bacterium]
MTLLIVAVAVGFAARRLSRTTHPLPVLVWPGVPLAAVGIQILNQVSGLGWTSLTVASHTLVTLWAVAIVHRQPSPARLGMTIVAIGFVLNLLPVAANGRMPVAESAARSIGFEIDESIEAGNLAKHQIARDGDRLLVLSDTMPITWLGAVVSPGDLAMALGAAVAICPVVPAAGRALRQPSKQTSVASLGSIDND